MVTANWRGCEGASHWKGNQYTHARRSRSSQLSALIAALFEESRQKVMGAELAKRDVDSDHRVAITIESGGLSNRSFSNCSRGGLKRV